MTWKIVTFAIILDIGQKMLVLEQQRFDGYQNDIEACPTATLVE
jgi:hypothetical protein